MNRRLDFAAQLPYSILMAKASDNGQRQRPDTGRSRDRVQVGAEIGYRSEAETEDRSEAETEDRDRKQKRGK